MTESFIDFAKVTKDYGSLRVVEDLDLSIARGEFVSLLGPSGSGKTTLLMMLAGFESVTGGTITLDGQRINDLPTYRRDMGVVFQNYALFPHMTVAKNVAFPLEMRGVGRAEVETRVARALDMVQLGQMTDRLPGQLSGGQQQRVALARALVFEPRVVLMDEPLGALDKQLREQMQLDIRDLHHRLGLTIIFVTHDQGEALTMSDRIAVFNDGRIQQLAPPSELYEKPQNSFVAGFIGENNKLSGVIEKLDGERAVVRLPNGELIDATAVNVREAGQPTLVSIRPERVEFKPEMMPQGAHTIDAEVRDVIYMGDILRARMKVAGSDEFVMKFRNTLGQTRLSPGQHIRIGWNPQDARALDPV